MIVFNWLRFLDKSNLLKIPDWGSFSVLKTLTCYQLYRDSANVNTKEFTLTPFDPSKKRALRLT